MFPLTSNSAFSAVLFSKSAGIESVIYQSSQKCCCITPFTLFSESEQNAFCFAFCFAIEMRRSIKLGNQTESEENREGERKESLLHVPT